MTRSAAAVWLDAEERRRAREGLPGAPRRRRPPAERLLAAQDEALERAAREHVRHELLEAAVRDALLGLDRADLFAPGRPTALRRQRRSLARDRLRRIYATEEHAALADVLGCSRVALAQLMRG